jgi:hypothetical protein
VLFLDYIQQLMGGHELGLSVRLMLGTLLIVTTVGRGTPSRPGGCQLGCLDHTPAVISCMCFLPYALLGLSLPGVRLVAWTILAVTWTMPSVINWCLRPHALLGLSLHSPGGVRLVTWTAYRLSSTEPCFDCKGCSLPGGVRLVAMDYTGCHQLNRVFTVQNERCEKRYPTLRLVRDQRVRAGDGGVGEPVLHVREPRAVPRHHRRGPPAGGLQRAHPGRVVALHSRVSLDWLHYKDHSTPGCHSIGYITWTVLAVID